ncbi:MAG: hypothetical protein K5650_05065 [Bacteroidales bacterium]|nr:hypothetical protein [Bacteroidales bacterium]
MKHTALILAAASLLISSCAVHYVATDSVDCHLDGTRQVLATSTDDYFTGWQLDTLATPLTFDFRSEKDTMRYAYTIDMLRNSWTLQYDSMPRLLQPEVTVRKSFRWFTTRYRYTARFPQLDSLPVPISDYLTPDEQRLLLNSNELPDDWTGTDLYSLLDNLNTKYVKWWDHCLFEKELEAYAALCDSAQRALLEKYHDTLLALSLAVLPNEFKSIGNVATAFPELEFINRMNSIGFDALHWTVDNWNLNTRVIWRTELPGRSVEHMVSADRMILGDYVIEEHSDTVNWWAILLTLSVAIAAVVLLSRRNRCKI